jgi:hypothetical protein
VPNWCYFKRADNPLKRIRRILSKRWEVVERKMLGGLAFMVIASGKAV